MSKQQVTDEAVVPIISFHNVLTKHDTTYMVVVRNL